MTRRLLCITTCLALCWCVSSSVNADDNRLSLSDVQDSKGYRGPVSPEATPRPDVTAAPSGAPRGPGLFTTGFEAGEGFAPGNIDGQVGWNNSEIAAGVPGIHGQIAGTNPNNGAQHLSLQAEPALAQGTILYAFSPTVAPLPLPGPSVLTLECFIPGTANADYRIQAQAATQGLITWRCQFTFDDTILVIDDVGAGFAIVDTNTAYPVDTYFELTVEFIPSTGQYTYKIDGTTFYTSVGGLFGGTIIDEVLIGSDNFQNPGEVGDFDDLNIAELVVGGGACCDTNTGICTDVADINDCIGAGLVFSNGTNCASVTCNIAVGACCTTGRVCTDGVTIGDCAAQGGTFFGDGSTCAANPCPVECPPGHTGQVTDGNGYGGTLASVSDRTRPLVCADNFVPSVSGTISSVRWWGLYVDLVAGAVCVDGAIPDDFQITYYSSGSDGTTEFPGSIVGGPFAVAASKVNTGFGGNGGIYEYDATHAPVSVDAGFCYWIEITNVSDTVCEWLWFVAPPGDSLSAQSDPTIPWEAGDVNNIFDLGFCVDIDINADGCLSSLPVPGACCLLTTQAGEVDGCIDSDADACGAVDGVFLGGFTTCATSSCVGACCLGETCQNETRLQCETIFGLFSGVGTDCNVIDPCTPQACCDGAGFCSDQPQDLCESSGGAFFAGVNCADVGFFCPSSDILGTIDVGCNGTLETNNSGLLSPEDAGFNPALNPNFSCAGDTPGAGEFWVSFTATDTSAFITTRNSGITDTIIEVHTGPDPFNLTPVPDSCADDDEPGVDFLSSVCIPTNIGDTYWVLVASFDNMPAEKGPVTVEIICPCPATCDTCPGDLDGNATLDGDDIQLFTSCLTGAEMSPAVCVCADMDNDNDADIDDVDEFVAAILAGGFCPGFPLQECPPGSQGQLPDLENGLASNANEASGMVADNFDTPTGGTINTITWWGVYLGAGCPAGADDFTVTIHNDDNNGTPGTVVANLTGQTPTAVATGRNLLGIADEYKYTLSGLSINLAPGCYWLKIGNSDVGGCVWFWSTSNDGDSISAFNADGSGYARVEGTDPVADDNDLSWCLSLTLGDNSTCTEPMGACCVAEVCQGNTTQDDCINNFAGSWFEGEDCGAGFVCPPTVNGGDECTDAIPLTCNGGVFVFDSSTLTAGGADPTSSCEIAVGGPFTHDASAWFTFQATDTTATITMCASALTEDSVMTLFGADESCAALTEFQCDDDFCVAPNFGPPQISAVGLTPGSNYFILVDFYSGGHTAGPHSIEITCP